MVTLPAMVPGDPIEISATSFVAYLRCPEQAAARFRGEYGKDSRAGFTGQLAHRIFARHLTGGEISSFEQACREEIGGGGLNMKVASLGLKPSQLRGVIEEASALYDRFKAMDFDGFSGSEVELVAEPSDGVILKGSVDAIFEEGSGWKLVDWKTGSIQDDAHHQLDFYALLWALDRAETPRRVEAISVRTGERHHREPSDRTLAETAELVADMVSSLRSAWSAGSSLPLIAGRWCTFCPVLPTCPEGAAAQRVIG